MRCPSCGAEVEEGADLCLECGEPMGDSPAARVARAESQPGPAAAPSDAAAPRAPMKASAIPSAFTATVRGKRSARVRDDDEREPVRCPGCGIPSKAARCPGCGLPLRTDD